MRFSRVHRVKECVADVTAKCVMSHSSVEVLQHREGNRVVGTHVAQPTLSVHARYPYRPSSLTPVFVCELRLSLQDGWERVEDQLHEETLSHLTRSAAQWLLVHTQRPWYLLLSLLARRRDSPSSSVLKSLPSDCSM